MACVALHVGLVSACTDSTAENFDALNTQSGVPCALPPKLTCMDPAATNYDCARECAPEAHAAQKPRLASLQTCRAPSANACAHTHQTGGRAAQHSRSGGRAA